MAPGQVFIDSGVMNHGKLTNSIDELKSGPANGKNQCIAGISVKTQNSGYHLPKDELSQQEIPPEAAYRMIQEDLALDIDPSHK